MLAWYAERLPTVEINNTFYRMPKDAVLELGRDAGRFRFAIKASRRITHERGSRRNGGRFGRVSIPQAGDARREARAGAVPVAAVPEKGPAAADGVPRPVARRTQRRIRVPQRQLVRDDVYDALKTAGAALCLSEREGQAPPPLVETAPGVHPASPRNLFRRRSAPVGRAPRGDEVAPDLRVFHARADCAGLRADADAVCVFLKKTIHLKSACAFLFLPTLFA